MERHPIEDSDSWALEMARQGYDGLHRTLKRHRHHTKHGHRSDNTDDSLAQIEKDREKSYLKDLNRKKEKKRLKAIKKHKKLLREMYADSGIQHSTVHGIMIDAGSTGSRLHLYEWEPRVLSSNREVLEAVSGRKLSFPTSTSRWTDRLQPGIATFASLTDDEIEESVKEYLSPLLDFAKTVLREKEGNFESYPIFFRATAGMRTLERADRSRVLGAIRSIFSDRSFCPFYFEDEYARVLSGEEEAVFGWAGINFAMGNLLEDSVGAGTVVNPKRTYGALDMGGASTQISFYEPNEDIMSDLFKLQVGQGKHWNLYAHSFLYFGINEARNRFHANLLAGTTASDRLVEGVYNPCLPGGTRQETRLNIHINANGEETWNHSVNTDGYYQATLINNSPTGDFAKCMEYTKSTLHLENNAWCEFAHKGDCSFNGVAMPELPTQSEYIGEFLAFSNYFHVWQFLGLSERSSLQQLYNATEYVCGMSKSELVDFNRRTGEAEEEVIDDICFRSAYAFNILRNGYGFRMDEYITATNVVAGQKLGWALGAMLYEINTLPFTMVGDEFIDYHNASRSFASWFVLMALLGVFTSVALIFVLKKKRSQKYYFPLKEAQPLLNAAAPLA
jgi:Golgi nucleoside diphosphatase